MHMHAYAGFPDRKGKGLLFCTSVPMSHIGPSIITPLATYSIGPGISRSLCGADMIFDPPFQE